MKKIFAVVIIFSLLCPCLFGCTPTVQDTFTVQDTYKSRCLAGISTATSWQEELITIAEDLIARYKATNPERTNYESVIVVGNFELFANGTADNYVCFSGSIRIFRYNSTALCWETNRYSVDFKSSKNLGRADFITYGTHISDINCKFVDSYTLLGTYGEGISTYWDYSCRDYGSADILAAESRADIWGSWSAKSSEDWYYRSKDTTYWTYRLNGIVIE